MDVDNILMTPIPISPMVHENNTKKRRSFFVPQNDSVLQLNDCEKDSTEIIYIKKIKTEEKQWKQLYEKKRENHKNLLKELKTNQTQMIDYNILNPEDIEFLNDSVDMEHFVRKAKKLQDKLKVAHLLTERNFKRKIMIMEEIEELSFVFKTEF